MNQNWGRQSYEQCWSKRGMSAEETQSVTDRKAPLRPPVYNWPNYSVAANPACPELQCEYCKENSTSAGENTTSSINREGSKTDSRQSKQAIKCPEQNKVSLAGSYSI